MKIVRVFGAGMGDHCFTLETVDPPITWNITRLQADATAGKFAEVTIPTSGMKPAEWSLGNLSRETVDYIKRTPTALDAPGILIENPPEDAFAYLCICDGQHRVTARQELRLAECRFYVVPHDKEREYRVDIEVSA